MHSKMSWSVLGSIGRVLFLITAGTVFALCLGSYLDPSWVHRLQQGTGSFFLLISATLVGFALPGPRYALYPLLSELLRLGLSPGIIVALVSAHVLVEPSAFVVEVGLFGLRFSLKRLLISFIIATTMGAIVLLLISSSPGGLR